VIGHAVNNEISTKEKKITKIRGKNGATIRGHG